jgi:hypothetical protein
MVKHKNVCVYSENLPQHTQDKMGPLLDERFREDTDNLATNGFGRVDNKIEIFLMSRKGYEMILNTLIWKIFNLSLVLRARISIVPG